MSNSSKPDKRKNKNDGEQTKKAKKEAPKLKMPVPTETVMIYENQTAAETLAPEETAAELFAKKFLAAICLVKCEWSPKEFKKYEADHTGKEIVRVEFSHKNGDKIILVINSSGDGGWHSTTLEREWVREKKDGTIISGKFPLLYKTEEEKKNSYCKFLGLDLPTESLAQEVMKMVLEGLFARVQWMSKQEQSKAREISEMESDHGPRALLWARSVYHLRHIIRMIENK